MALTRGIFIRKDGKSVTDPAGTDPRSARKAMSGLVAGNADGVPRSGIFPQKDVLIVIGSQAGMVYRVKPFEGALIRDAAGSDGVVLYANDALTDVPTSPAPSTGSRWDLVYVQYPESTSDSTSSKPVLGVVQGTASGTPSKPSAALPANSYLLAESLVSAGNSTTVDASINQVWRYTAPRGVPIPVRNQTERDELSAPYPGLRIVALDRPGTPVMVYSGGKWQPETPMPAFGHAGMTGAFQNVSSPDWTTLKIDAAQELVGGVTFDAAAKALVVPASGRYQIVARYYATGTGGGNGVFGRVMYNRNGTVAEVEGSYASFWKGNGNDFINVSTLTRNFQTGDKIFMQMVYASSSWGTTGYNGSWLELLYIGPSAAY